MDSFGIEEVSRVYLVVRVGDDATIVDLEESALAEPTRLASTSASCPRRIATLRRRWRLDDFG
jgi:hypothetical protein